MRPSEIKTNSPDSLADEEHRKRYAMVLQRVEHEHALENNRLNWFFAFEGFLFAGVGFGSNESVLAVPAEFFKYIVPSVGIAVAIVTLLGLLAAQWSRNQFKVWYAKGAKGMSEDDWPHPPLSPSKAASRVGRLTVRVIPIVIVLGWISLLLMC